VCIIVLSHKHACARQCGDDRCLGDAAACRKATCREKPKRGGAFLADAVRFRHLSSKGPFPETIVWSPCWNRIAVHAPQSRAWQRRRILPTVRFCYGSPMAAHGNSRRCWTIMGNREKLSTVRPGGIPYNGSRMCSPAMFRGLRQLLPRRKRLPMRYAQSRNYLEMPNWRLGADGMILFPLMSRRPR